MVKLCSYGGSLCNDCLVISNFLVCFRHFLCTCLLLFNVSDRCFILEIAGFCDNCQLLPVAVRLDFVSSFRVSNDGMKSHGL